MKKMKQLNELFFLAGPGNEKLIKAVSFSMSPQLDDNLVMIYESIGWKYNLA